MNMGGGEPNQNIDRLVTLAELEGAASGICKLSEHTNDYPELVARLEALRKLLGAAADAFAKGDRDGSTKIFRELNRKRAAMVCGGE